MKAKIALSTLLVILALATIVVTTAATFKEAPSTNSVKTNSDEEICDNTTWSGEVQLQGDEKPGGWPEQIKILTGN